MMSTGPFPITDRHVDVPTEGVARLRHGKIAHRSRPQVLAIVIRWIDRIKRNLGGTPNGSGRCALAPICLLPYRPSHAFEIQHLGRGLPAPLPDRRRVRRRAEGA